jgi:hypothetical protein
MTATTYTIYIINQSGTNQVFWCFEAPPHKLATNAADYVNSGAVRAISLRQADANFEVSAQEVGTEGAGLNAEIVSDVACDASLREPIELSYLRVQLTQQPSQQASPVTYYVTIGRDITAGSDGGDVLASSNEQPTNSLHREIRCSRPMESVPWSAVAGAAVKWPCPPRRAGTFAAAFSVKRADFRAFQVP